MTSDIPASRPISRRRYSAELKAEVLAQCDESGALVAKVAMSHGINANVVHRWVSVRRATGERCGPVNQSENRVRLQGVDNT